MEYSIEEVKKISKKICSITILFLVLTNILVLAGSIVLSPVAVITDKRETMGNLISMICVSATVYLLTKEYAPVLGIDIKPMINKSFDYRFFINFAIATFGVNNIFEESLAWIFKKLETFGIIFDSNSGFTFKPEALYMIVGAISLLIIAPLFEEIFFRGLLFNGLKNQGVLFAIIGSAILFGGAHGSQLQIMGAFLCGVECAYIMHRTGSLVPGIILHFLNNFLFMINMGIEQTSMAHNPLDYIAYFTMIYSVFALIKYRKKIKAFILENKGPSLRYMFSSWQGVLLLIVFILKMIPEIK